MLQVRENEISLGKWFGGTAHLPNLEGTLQKMFVQRCQQLLSYLKGW